METILANGFSWLTRHVPALAFVIFVMISTAWVTIMINNFDHQLANAEQRIDDINVRQLPEIRGELKSINDRLARIELQLNTVITYIETREGLKPNSLKN